MLCKLAKKGSYKPSYPAITTMNHNDYHGKIALKLWQWSKYLGGHQQLSNWTKDLCNKRETMFGTENLTNHPELVKSQILEKNL